MSANIINGLRRMIGLLAEIDDEEERDGAANAAAMSIVVPIASWIGFLALPATSAAIAVVAIGICLGFIVSLCGLMHGALFSWGSPQRHWKRERSAGLLGLIITLPLIPALVWSAWRLIA